MSHIETIKKDGKNLFIGVVEFDSCQEIIDNFDGEIQGDRYVIENSNNVIDKLFKSEPIEAFSGLTKYALLTLLTLFPQICFLNADSL